MAKSKWLLSSDPDRGVQTFYIPDGDQFHIETVQDVQPILEQNAALRNDGTGGWNKDKSWRRVASIPNAVMISFMQELGHYPSTKRDWDFMRQKMNDIDYRKLRTAEWNV
jgi:hypothetical protein